MKSIKYLFVIVSFILFSCDTQIVDVVDEFTFAKGGYMRTVTPFPVTLAATFKASKANMAGTKLELVAEAVTENNGAQFASYEMVIKFEDQTKDNGNKSTTDKALKTIQANQYAVNATTGYPRATITVTGQEALTACGLTVADVTTKDYFTILTTMVLTDGRKFGKNNTGLNITGGAFYSSPFEYRINVID